MSSERSPEPGRPAACPEGGEVSPPGSRPPAAGLCCFSHLHNLAIPSWSRTSTVPRALARHPPTLAESPHLPLASPLAGTSNLVAPCPARTNSLIGRPESCSPVAPNPLPSAQDLRDPHCLPPVPRSSLTLESPGVAPSVPS